MSRAAMKCHRTPRDSGNQLLLYKIQLIREGALGEAPRLHLGF